MPEQVIDFRLSGLDTDSDLRVMRPGDSPYRLNALVDCTDDNSDGNITNQKGSLFRNYQRPISPNVNPNPGGQDVVVGSCKDYERDAIIYAVWNSNNFHEIRRIYRNSNQIELILQHPKLNFKRKKKVGKMHVLNNQLFWTTGWVNPNNEWDYDPPHKINIENCIKYTHGTGPYSVIDDQTLIAIRYAPLICPTVNFNSNQSVLSTALRGNLYQFCYRWIYEDNEPSAFSPLSPLMIPQNEDANGNYNPNKDNEIEIIVGTGHQTVRKIQIVAKVNGSYYIIEELEKFDESGNQIIPNNSTFMVLYYGTRIVSEISEKEILKQYDFVPQVAEREEIVQGNTLIYGNYIEGYAAPEVDIDIVDKYKRATDNIPAIYYPFGNPTNLSNSFGNHIFYKALSFKRLGIYRVGIVYRDAAGRAAPVSSPKDGVQIKWWADFENDIYFNPQDNWINTFNQKPYIEWNIKSQPPIWAHSYSIVCTKNIKDLEKQITFVQWAAALGDEDGIYQNKRFTILLPQNVGYSFEPGDRIRIIGKYTSGSSFGIAQNAQADPTIGTNFYFERVMDTYKSYPTTNPNQQILDFCVTSYNPGTGRLAFQGEIGIIDYELSLPLRKQEAGVLYVFEIYNPTRKTTDSEIFYDTGNDYLINNPGQPNRSHSITTGIIEGIDIFHRWKRIDFKPQRVRFGVDYIKSPPPGDPCFEAFLIGDINLKTSTRFENIVLDLNDAFGSVFFPNNTSKARTKCLFVSDDFNQEKYSITIKGGWQTLTMSYGDDPNKTMIGIFAGNYAVDNSFAVIDQIFSISNGYVVPIPSNDKWKLDMPPKTYIEFETINGPVTITNVNKRFVVEESVSLFILVEDHAFSDYYPSNIDSTGKGWIEDYSYKRKRYPTGLRNGGKIIPNTFINYILSFEEQDTTIGRPDALKDQHGPIHEMMEVGYTLKVMQTTKVSSIYIGRVEYQDSAGQIQVVTSDRLIGTINPYTEDYGCISPGTYVKSKRNSYFFDVTNGVVIRDAVNGMIPISGFEDSANDPYKMSKYFRDLARQIRENSPEDFNLIGVWDELRKCYILTVQDTRREILGRPNLSQTLIFHEPTNRWKTFESYVPEWYENIGDTLYAFRNGECWQHHVNPIRNSYFGVQYPTIVDVVCNLAPTSIKVFNNIEVHSNKEFEAIDIEIPPSDQYPNGMKSRIKKFQPREGRWVSSFKKDMNTPGFNNPTLALISGRELRGQAIKIRLQNNDEELVSLRQVIVFVTGSELTV